MFEKTLNRAARWAGVLAVAAGLAGAPAGAQVVAGAAAPRAGEAALEPKKVYVIELKGWFGKDISQTPIRQAVIDAKRYQPDYLIFVLENDFSLYEGLVKLPQDVMGFFDQLFRAEDMEPIFTNEIAKEWDKQPEVVFWVKNAMGGAAFLPLVCPNIYFHPDGRMGGIGGVEERMKGWGDEVVIQKQLSLRLKHAEGMAIKGGYDSRLIEAMALDSYVLSVRFDGDQPVFLERMPENDAEYLLTDDGKDENADTDAQKARAEGNDVLTLNADLAYKLKLSKGTAATMDDLLFLLGISRNHEIVKGRADSIMKSWRDGVASYGRDLRRLWRDYEAIQVQGNTPRERNQKRGQQISKLEAMQKIIKKYQEGIDPREEGMPTYEQLSIMIGQIRSEMQRDK